MRSVVGVVSLQGDYAKHRETFARIHPAVDSIEVRTPEDLTQCDRLVLPGGESTTVGKLMQRFGLGEAILEKAQAGMPIWGTCMGMILMASRIEGHEQYTLDLLDISVRRNAFGSQIHSFEDSVVMPTLDSEVLGVFIRAPIVTEIGPDVQILGEYENQIVAVRQGNRLGTSFHPELTDDLTLHEWFLTF